MFKYLLNFYLSKRNYWSNLT